MFFLQEDTRHLIVMREQATGIENMNWSPTPHSSVPTAGNQYASPYNPKPATNLQPLGQPPPYYPPSGLHKPPPYNPSVGGYPPSPRYDDHREVIRETTIIIATISAPSEDEEEEASAGAKNE